MKIDKRNEKKQKGVMSAYSEEESQRVSKLINSVYIKFKGSSHTERTQKFRVCTA